MPPLAQFLKRQSMARPKDRIGIWSDPKNVETLKADLDGITCFEITAALPLVRQLAETLNTYEDNKLGEFITANAFLPAPKTWIERRADKIPDDLPRVAILLDPSPPGVLPGAAGITFVSLFAAESMSIAGVLTQDDPRRVYCVESANHEAYPGDIPLDQEQRAEILRTARYALAIINSPKVVSRQQHPPHKGLMREVRRHKNFGEAFQLLPWHEIKLQITKPRAIDDGVPHQDQITGQRALHFVRKFMRIRLGRLEYVSAHWRGDPALGIHQSDYRVSV